MVKRITITFHKCIHNSQEFGSDDESMVSRLYFSLEANGRVYKDLYVNLKQTVGFAYTERNIEVGPPIVYRGAFNQEAFREAARQYYLVWVGPNARGTRVAGGGQPPAYNNTFVGDKSVEILLP
jgi:hypothetical protein